MEWREGGAGMTLWLNHRGPGDYDKKVPWPPILGLYRSVVVTLTYMRRNRVQVELAETYEVSQSTISRAIARLGFLRTWFER